MLAAETAAGVGLDYREMEMGWDRRRLLVALGAAALVVASCGGGGGETSTTADERADTTIVGDDEDADAPIEPVGDEDGEDSAGESGERSAVISIDGEPTTYHLDDVTFSPVDGVDDLTFETCNPDFFGSGRFYAIGYAVDGDGEVIVGDDGQPGMFTMDLPPDDWEEAQRDAPDFEITLGDIDIKIASPDEAAGGTMSWTIEDTRASGTAVFVDFENTYSVDFEIVCEGSPTVDLDDLPTEDNADAGDSGGGGGFPLAGAGVGSFTVDGESFDNVDVYSCEPFSFGSDPHPDDVSLLAYLGGTSGLEVAISHRQGVDMSDGSQFEQIDLDVFHSRQGESGLEQFEGGAASAADGTWFTTDPETLEHTPLDTIPVVIEGDRVTGALAGLRQTWPDEGAATVDVTFDLEVPTEVNEEC